MACLAWDVRNKHLFQQEHHTIKSLLSPCLCFYSDVFQLFPNFSSVGIETKSKSWGIPKLITQHSPSQRFISWMAPPFGVLVVNFDGAVDMIERLWALLYGIIKGLCFLLVGENYYHLQFHILSKY